MMFENLEELLRETSCIVHSQQGTTLRRLFWNQEGESWTVTEIRRYAKKTKTLYQGNDLREAMQYLK